MEVKAPCPHCGENVKLRSESTNPLTCEHCEQTIKFESMGKFWLIQELGKGSYGKVYRAYDPKLEREVAIKILHETVTNRQGIDRFYREAKLTAKITHPNVASVFDYGDEQEQLYLVSALIQGRELKHYITNRGFPDINQAITYAITLLDTLHEVHEHYGTWHRDVKPSNIMISDRGVVYLLDFGIAASRDPDLPKLTVANQQMGTPSYMPPEQVKPNLDVVGPKSDQYSLAVVIYQMLTGRLPFEAPQIVDLFMKILTEEPTPPSHFRPEIDADLERIVMKAMAKSTSKRYQSCQQFADALRAWQSRNQSTIVNDQTVQIVETKSNTLTIVAIVVAVAFLGLLGFLIFGGKGGKGGSGKELPDFKGNKALLQPQ